MGLQTTVVLLNDYCSDIKSNQDLGEQLASMISRGETGNVEGANGVKIIETHHTDFHALVRLGGGGGRLFGYIGGKHPFDLAKEAAVIIGPHDPTLATQIAKATTPESMLPLAKRALSKVGRKSRFDQDKVTPEEWNKLADFYVATLENVLELAYHMRQELK